MASVAPSLAAPRATRDFTLQPWCVTGTRFAMLRRFDAAAASTAAATASAPATAAASVALPSAPAAPLALADVIVLSALAAFALSLGTASSCTWFRRPHCRNR